MLQPDERAGVMADESHYRRLDLPALMQAVKTFPGPRWQSPAMFHAIERLLAQSETELVTADDLAAVLGEPDEKSSTHDDLWTYYWQGAAGPLSCLSETTVILRADRVIGARSSRSRRNVVDTDNTDARQKRRRYRAMA
jgi:hypothetical protein